MLVNDGVPVNDGGQSELLQLSDPELLHVPGEHDKQKTIDFAAPKGS